MAESAEAARGGLRFVWIRGVGLILLVGEGEGHEGVAGFGPAVASGGDYDELFAVGA